MGDGQWFGNKELYVMINDLTQALALTNVKLDAMSAKMDKYNNLVEQVEELKTQRLARKELLETTIKVGGFLIAAISFFVAYFTIRR